MVARSPPKRIPAPAKGPISPTFLRETIKKVDGCVARLEELQNTIKGFNVSPRSRSCTRATIRHKQESVRMKNVNPRRSPTSKLPINQEDWQRISIPAMLLGETMGEIMQASEVAKKAVESMPSKPADDPKTPLTQRRKTQKLNAQGSVMNAKRTREKKGVLQSRQADSKTPADHRGKSKRIIFKIVSPECNKENSRYRANRVSPKNKPWGRKSVLFPNPLFHSSPISHQQKFYKTKSPVIGRKQQTPHKFLIKSPPKFQMNGKLLSPTRLAMRSPPNLKVRRSFSPSALVKRLVSPMKIRNPVQKNDGRAKMVNNGLRHGPQVLSDSHLVEFESIPSYFTVCKQTMQLITEKL